MTENLDHISWLWTFIDLQCKNDVYSLAAEQGQVVVVNFVIDQIIDKNPKPKKLQGLTLLHCVAYHGHFEVVQIIVEKIDDKNPRAEDGRTPMHFAAAKGHLEIVNLSKY